MSKEKILCMKENKKVFEKFETHQGHRVTGRSDKNFNRVTLKFLLVSSLSMKFFFVSNSFLEVSKNLFMVLKTIIFDMSPNTFIKISSKFKAHF